MVMRRKDDKLTFLDIDEAARDWTSALEAKESKRSGVPIRVARKIVARRAGLAPGTLENIKLRRTKGIRAAVFEKIRMAFMAEAQREIQRIEHDIQIARQIGMDARCSEVQAMESDRAALLDAMKR